MEVVRCDQVRECGASVCVASCGVAQEFGSSRCG